MEAKNGKKKKQCRIEGYIFYMGEIGEQWWVKRVETMRYKEKG